MNITYNVNFDTLMGIITGNELFTNTTTGGIKSSALNRCDDHNCVLLYLLDYTVSSFPEGAINTVARVIVPSTSSSEVQNKAALIGLSYSDLVDTTNAVQSFNCRFFVTELNYGIALYESECVVTYFENGVSDSDQVTFVFRRRDPKYKIVENYFNGLWNTL